MNATRKKVDNPKDSDGLPVYLSTLTVGNVGNNISLTGMNVNGFPYDVNDVKTDGSGKVYCWLPAVSVRPEVQVSSTYYGLTYTPNADNNNTQTLPQLSSTVALISVVQTGGQLSTKNSTGIRLTFGSAVPWLLISDLFLRDDTGAAVKGASLTDHGGGTSWTLSLADVTTQGTILVGVRGNASIGITGTPQPVEVYKGISAPTTSGVIITPAAVKVQKGFTQAFTAVVQGGVGVPQTVVWSVTDEAGNTLGSGTTINAFSGLLTVSANEPLNVLHVVATSTAGHTVSGRAVVSLYAQSSLPGSGGEVTTPPGGDPIPDEDGGGVSLPGGGEFTDPVDGSEYDLPPGTVIDGDGNITTGDGDGTVVTDEGGRIDIPGDTHITPDGDDAGHTVVEPGPDGATVTYPDGSQVEVPGDGSIIIIDPSAPGGLRIECPVRFALAPGVSVDPAGEVNYVPMGRNFDFTLTPPSRDLAFTVTTGRIINGVPEKLLGHLNVDGTYTYTVREVRQAVVVTVATYLNVGNEKISSGHRVWTEGNRLFVDVAKPTTVSIYTVTGKLYSIRKVPAGQTSFVLEGPGIYVVEIDGSISKLRTSIN